MRTAALRGERVPALVAQAPVGERRLAGLGERDPGPSTEADPHAPALSGGGVRHHELLHSALRPGRGTCRYSPLEPSPSKSWRPCFASAAVAVRTRTSVSRERVVLAMSRPLLGSFFRRFGTDDNGGNRTMQVVCGQTRVPQPIEWMMEMDKSGH